MVELLQTYADSVGYRFPYFDNKMDAVKVIKREAERMFLEKEAVSIVTELKRAGANAENFYHIQPESIAPLFSYLNEDIDKFYKVFWEVERQIWELRMSFQVHSP